MKQFEIILILIATTLTIIGISLMFIYHVNDQRKKFDVYEVINYKKYQRLLKFKIIKNSNISSAPYNNKMEVSFTSSKVMFIKKRLPIGYYCYTIFISDILGKEWNESKNRVHIKLYHSRGDIENPFSFTVLKCSDRVLEFLDALNQ